MNLPLTQEEFEFIYQRVPRICVDLIVMNQNQQILLTKRTGEPHLGKWHLPGGAIRFKESIDDAIRRIAKTELDIEDGIIIRQCRGIINFPNEIRDEKQYHSISLVFQVLSNKEPSDGMFFSYCPENIIPEHGEFLKANYNM